MELELDTKIIGIRIKQRRLAANMTQDELAEKTEISKNQISNIERGESVPTTVFLFRLCNVLGETPDYYLIGKITEDVNQYARIAAQLPDPYQNMLLQIAEVINSAAHSN